MLIDIFLFILLIYLFSVSPLPALPIIIASYSKMGFFGGFLSTVIAANLAIFSQYYLGKSLRKNKFSWSRFQNLIDKYSYKVKNFSTLDLFLIRLSNVFITKIINLLLGFTRYPLKKLLIINNIANLPWQLLNYFFASKVDLLSDLFLKINISFSIINLFSIVSSSCLVILSGRTITFLLRKIFKNKFNRF